MFKYIKKLIQFGSQNSGPNQTFTISFLKKEKSLIYQGAVEVGRRGRTDATFKGLRQFQVYNEKLNAATTFIVEKLNAPDTDLLPDIVNQECLNNVTDLRTCEEFHAFQNSTVDISQLPPKCEEVPRRFIYKKPKVTDNYKILSSSKHLFKQNHNKLREPSNIIQEIQRIMFNIKRRRVSKKIQKNLGFPLERKTVDEVLSKPTEASQEIEELELESSKLLRNMIKFREASLKKPEKQEVPKKENVIINMDNIVEYEESMRRARLGINDTKTANEEVIKEKCTKHKDDLFSDVQAKDYMFDVLQLTRLIESKMTRPKETRTEVTKKTDSVKTGITNADTKKIESNTNKEHTVGKTGPLGNPEEKK